MQACMNKIEMLSGGSQSWKQIHDSPRLCGAEHALGRSFWGSLLPPSRASFSMMSFLSDRRVSAIFSKLSAIHAHMQNSPPDTHKTLRHTRTYTAKLSSIHANISIHAYDVAIHGKLVKRQGKLDYIDGCFKGHSISRPSKSHISKYKNPCCPQGDLPDRD